MIRKVHCLDKDFNFAFFAGQYGNGRMAIQVGDHDEQEQWGTLTVNVPHAEVGKDEIVVKTYSENAYWVPQVLEAMPDVFEDTGRRVSTGFTEVEIWKVKQPIPALPRR